MRELKAIYLAPLCRDLKSCKIICMDVGCALQPDLSFTKVDIFLIERAFDRREKWVVASVLALMFDKALDF